MNPVGLYAECSTMGTIVILVVYFLTTLSLPVFMWRRHRDTFSPVRHVVVPALGVITLVVPFVELCKPGPALALQRLPVRRPSDRGRRRRDRLIVVHRHPRAGAGEGAAFPGP